MGLGEEATVGLPMKERELSWSLDGVIGDECSLDVSLSRLVIMPLEFREECAVSVNRLLSSTSANGRWTIGMDFYMRL